MMRSEKEIKQRLDDLWIEKLEGKHHLKYESYLANRYESILMTTIGNLTWVLEDETD